MEINVRTLDAVKVIELNGEIDGKSAPQVQTQLSTLIKEPGGLIIDMSKVDYMASAGLRILISLRRKLTAEDNLVLVGLNEQIRETMTITGFIKLFTMFDGLEQGLNFFQTANKTN